jgi:hypothetical protein
MQSADEFWKSEPVISGGTKDVGGGGGGSAAFARSPPTVDTRWMPVRPKIDSRRFPGDTPQRYHGADGPTSGNGLGFFVPGGGPRLRLAAKRYDVDDTGNCVKCGGGTCASGAWLECLAAETQRG